MSSPTLNYGAMGSSQHSRSQGSFPDTLSSDRSLDAKFEVAGFIYYGNNRGMVLLQLCLWKFSHKETL